MAKTKHYSLVATNTYLPFSELRNNVKLVLQQHKGFNNSVSSHDLFRKVYNVFPEKINRIEHRYLMAQRLISAIKSLRNLDFFVCNIRDHKQGHIFYIPATISDYAKYKEANNIRIHNIQQLTKQCYNFVTKKNKTITLKKRGKLF